MIDCTLELNAESYLNIEYLFIYFQLKKKETRTNFFVSYFHFSRPSRHVVFGGDRFEDVKLLSVGLSWTANTEHRTFRVWQLCVIVLCERFYRYKNYKHGFRNNGICQINAGRTCGNKRAILYGKYSLVFFFHSLLYIDWVMRHGFVLYKLTTHGPQQRPFCSWNLSVTDGVLFFFFSWYYLKW